MTDQYGGKQHCPLQRVPAGLGHIFDEREPRIKKKTHLFTCTYTCVYVRETQQS